MNLQLWTTSKLGRIPYSLRKDIYFFAPLTESLEFMGIEPVAFARAALSTRIGRDGLVHQVAANVPSFNFNVEQPRGLWMFAGETLQFSPANGLNDSNTLIWFEDEVPKYTPQDANPIASTGHWVGRLDVVVKYLLKAKRQLTVAEIFQIQDALADVPFVPPEPPTPPATVDVGIFVTEVPAGTRNGSNVTFTLSNDPILDSVLLNCFGVTLRRVTSGPANMEYTLSGTGNRTVTMGLAPLASGYPFFAIYNRTGSQVGFLRKETPAGVRNGSNRVFTLAADPISQSIFLTCFGSPLMQVSPAATPQEMEFTSTGTGGRTLTLGMAPTANYPFQAIYLGTS